MKRKLLLVLAVAAAGMLMLTACTSSENGKTEGTGDKSDTQTVEGTVTGTDSVQNGSDVQSSDEAAADTSSDSAAAGNAASGNGSEGTGVSADNTQGEIYAPEPGEPGYDEPDGEIVPDEDADAAEAANAAQDIWSGNYSSAAESVTITLNDDGTFAFSFAQSGIYGTAEVNGTQAVYHGDDYHVVVFNVNGDTVEISVSSEEDFDASASPLNGSYTRN